MNWECGLCGDRNGELAESCSGCGAIHIDVECCGLVKAERRTHVIREKRICSECMRLEDYIERIDALSNVWESSNWLEKHCDEIQERPQDFIEELMNRHVDHHVALQEAHSE